MFRSSCTALAITATAIASGVHAAALDLDTAAIESITGLKGSYNKTENVFKISKPRDDIKVNVDRWTLPPFMGITSWAAFTPMGNATMVMGDTVLFEDEVNAAMSAALDGGLEVTAMHNHFFFDQPKVFFMHIGGTGDTRRLASAVKAMRDRIAQVRAAQATPASSFPGDIPSPSSISAAPIEQRWAPRHRARTGNGEGDDRAHRAHARRFGGQRYGHQHVGRLRRQR